jgi:phage tail protein X
MLLWLEERLYRALPGKTEAEMAANAGAASVVAFLRHHREVQG